MLILTRKVGESIVITTENGREITVMLVAIKGEQVRLGISAPREILVLRSELAAEAQLGVEGR